MRCWFTPSSVLIHVEAAVVTRRGDMNTKIIRTSILIDFSLSSSKTCSQKNWSACSHILGGNKNERITQISNCFKHFKLFLKRTSICYYIDIFQFVFYSFVVESFSETMFPKVWSHTLDGGSDAKVFRHGQNQKSSWQKFMSIRKELLRTERECCKWVKQK